MTKPPQSNTQPPSTATPAGPLICEQRRGEVVMVTMCRPQRHNVLNSDLVDALLECTERYRQQPPRALILRGEGQRAFCAGADIHEMAAHSDAGLRDFLQRTRRLFRQLAELPFPTIAAVNGHAHGGGAELACACDLRLGTLSTTFRFPGVVYGMAVSSWQLPLLVGVPKAKELLFTTDTITGDEALRIGLLNRLVPAEKLDERAWEMAERIAAHPPEAVASVKTLVDRNVGAPLVQRFYRELYANQDRGVAGGVRERFSQFLERDRGDDEGD